MLARLFDMISLMMMVWLDRLDVDTAIRHKMANVLFLMFSLFFEISTPLDLA